MERSNFCTCSTKQFRSNFKHFVFNGGKKYLNIFHKCTRYLEGEKCNTRKKGTEMNIPTADTDTPVTDSRNLKLLTAKHNK